jgi:murein L,D-transpeptidase YcbB/YkuD
MLPDGTVLKLGDRGPAVALLRLRLAAEGDLATEGTASPTFDGDLSTTVMRFQARHGLPESGAVRTRTLAALNVPADARHRQLAASAQRLMLAGAKIPAGERYVVVNIPSAAVEAVENGQVVRRYVRSSGSRTDPRPWSKRRSQAVNLNPTWTVPVSLIRKDIIPQMRKDPSYLAKMKIRVLDGKGQEVDPATIDWSSNSAVNYTLRQDPGATNSLGQIRIDMPNRHAVYLHDTPKKRLFGEEARFHSSGCVRVADVLAFTEWLLRDTPARTAPGRELSWMLRSAAEPGRTFGSSARYRWRGSISPGTRQPTAWCISGMMCMGSTYRRPIRCPRQSGLTSLQPPRSQQSRLRCS